jgi:hypothetical protein
MLKRASLLAVLILAACAGTTAREEVLLPAMRVAWPAIAESVELAGGDPTPMTLALEDGLVEGVDWPSLMIYAHEGVDIRLAAGEIGPNGAKIFRKRILAFDDAFRRMIR